MITRTLSAGLLVGLIQLVLIVVHNHKKKENHR